MEMWSNRNERKEEKKRKKEIREKNKKDKRAAQNPPLRILLQEGYMECLQTLPVDENSILLESEYGEKLGDAVRSITEVLAKQPEYQNYKIYLTCNKEKTEEFQDYLSWIGMPEIQAVGYGSPEYYQALATAKFLFNDGNFVPHFVKRKGQIYIKLWNMIPARPGGRYAETKYGQIGNVQKNLLSADYLLCPNEMTMESLVDNYMLANIGKTKFVFTGNFRNKTMCCAELAEEIRENCQWKGKTVFLYQPAVHGRAGGELRLAEEENLRETLSRLEKELTENQVLLVDVPKDVQKGIDFSGYKKITVMPKKYTIYQLFNVVDTLITDSSFSVFDFAVTRKKIILFDYMQKDAFEAAYQLHPELPFPKVPDVDGLVKELNQKINYDDSVFYKKYCRHNRPDMAELVCRKILLGEAVPEIMVKVTPDNGKKNILIYPGTLSQNGITSSIISLLSRLDTNKNNYIIFYRMELLKDKEEVLRQFPENVTYYGFTHIRGVSGKDRKLYNNWIYEEKYSYAKAEKMLNCRIAYEVERLLSFCRIDTVVQYDGYGTDAMMMFEKMPCNRIIYVHNDMVKELKKKSGIRKEILRNAYRNYDHVALVSEEQRSMTEKIAGYSNGNNPAENTNIVLAKNIINYQRVEKLKEEEFFVDGQSQLSMDEKELERLLSSDKKKFITIGRFSAEKGHMRLLDAFEQLHREHPDTCLVILGGYGNLFEKTMEKAKSLEAAADVAVIQYLSNPYALLKRCDYFVLSSFYEGLPVVITEADLVGLPCISTDIPGPRAFMKQYGGMLVENSTDGVLDGMKKCLSGEVPEKLNINYEQYNMEAIEQFERML